MGALTLLVTGAEGYLGRAVVAEARDRGHAVRRLTRGPGGDVICDLAGDLPDDLMVGVDRVIHCAARLTGTEAEMRRDTVQATAHLCAAAARAQVPVVLAGSIAVYAGAAGPEIDEESPLETDLAGRDAYTAAKLAQEAAARAAGGDLRILRIGAIWGPGRLWNAHLGAFAGPVFLRMGAGEIPLSHVENAAHALILAAEGAWSGVETVNVVDDERPDAAAWLTALPQPPRLTISFPRGILLALAPLAGRLTGSPPGLLRPATIGARLAPRRYSNARLHALGWSPRVTLQDGLAAAKDTA